MSEPTPTTGAAGLSEAVERTLRENGLSDRPDLYDSSIHSWRCEHPDQYGPCTCFQEVVADLVAAVGPVEAAVAARVRAEGEARVADAWDDGYAAGQVDEECRAENPHRRALDGGHP